MNNCCKFINDKYNNVTFYHKITLTIYILAIVVSSMISKYCIAKSDPNIAINDQKLANHKNTDYGTKKFVNDSVYKSMKQLENNIENLVSDIKGLRDDNKILAESMRIKGEEVKGLGKSINDLSRKIMKHGDKIQKANRTNNCISWATLIVLLATLIFVFINTRINHRLKKETIEANIFNALTKIHDTISNDKSYTMRRYLHDKRFSIGLVTATREVCGKAFIEVDKIDVDKVLVNLNEDNKKREKFNEELYKQEFTFTDTERVVNPLDIVEKVLADFDSIAIPYYEGIEAAKKSAGAYNGVLLRTYPIILPFIAIQIKLRGKSDKEYKIQYRYLMMKLLEKVGDNIPDKLKVSEPKKHFFG
jgi:uncharacterized protein YoxC